MVDSPRLRRLVADIDRLAGALDAEGWPRSARIWRELACEIRRNPSKERTGLGLRVNFPGRKVGAEDAAGLG